MLSAHFVLVWS